MTLEDEIKEFIAKELGEEKVKRESHLINDLKADSLDLVSLNMELEDKYKIKIPEEEAEKLRTVGDIIDYIIHHYKENPDKKYGTTT